LRHRHSRFGGWSESRRNVTFIIQKSQIWCFTVDK
jgi:hypothetical protein